MDNVRCPMCGKPNPAEQETCRYCQARLKPLIVSRPPEPPKPPPGQTAILPGGAPVQQDTGELEDSLPDWLRDLRRDEKKEELPPPKAEVEDWLSSLREGIGGTGPLPAAESETEWSADFGEAAENELPDWLSAGGAPSPAKKEIAPSGGAPETFNWLQQIRDESPAASPAAKPKDWEVPSSFAPSSPREQPEEAMPDWLAGLLASSEGEAAAPPTAAAPDRLAELPGKPAEPAAKEAPDWLAEFATPAPPAPADETPTAATTQAPLTELPDWLSEIVTPARGVEQEPAPAADWLSDFSVLPGEAAAEAEPLAPSEETWGIPSSAEPEGAAPDWLASLQAGFTEPPAEGAGAEVWQQYLPPEEGAATPDWLAGLVAASTETVSQPPVAPAFTELPSPAEIGPAESLYPSELPDWLSRETPQEAAPETAEAEPVLGPSTLPTWLEAMRPVEAVAPAAPFADESDAKVEAAGPLAGLRGVLPAEPEIAGLQKPPTHALKIQVSEKQRKHAELLKGMLEREGEARPLPPRPLVSPQHLLRGAIALILIAVVLWPLLSGVQRSPLPAFPAETAEINRLIGELPVDARVLVAFDYQSGLLGEMDAAAAAVVDHLMVRGAYLTLVSTSPAGPILGEHFLREVQGAHNYQSKAQYVNLGYIPGGPTGLLSFAESPQRTLPLTLESDYAWGKGDSGPLPPLQGIRKLSDYSLALVITDDAETARAWIEQARPYLNDADGQTPLAMVISAQAEPMVRPYYEATPRQVEGLVTGLRGGASYARLTGRAGLSRAYWEPFSAGLVVAVLLISIGGLFNMVTAALADLKSAAKPAPPSAPKTAKNTAQDKIKGKKKA